MSDPVISVVMSVYNCERFLAEAVDSILNQTFRDFEFIIINDGSTDRSEEILGSFARRDNRIRLVSRANKGLAASLNEGIALARGKWIARMDADDIALPNRFERQLEWLGHTGADLCGSSVRVFGSCVPHVLRYRQSHSEIKVQLLFNSAFAHPTLIARASVLKQYPYDGSWDVTEDYDLWTRLALSDIYMTNSPDVLLRYRRSRDQVSSVKQTRQREQRTLIARRYWAARDLSLPIASIVSFSEIDDVRKLLQALHFDQLSIAERSVVMDACWKMAMRSGQLGDRLLTEMRLCGLHYNWAKSLLLNAFLRFGNNLSRNIFNLLYRVR